MASTWQSYALPKLPSSVQTAVDSFTSAVGAVTSVMQVLKGLLQALAAVEGANLSATQMAIKSAVDAIEGATQSLLEDAGVYVLFVPPRKRLVVSPVVGAALQRAGVSLEEFLASAHTAGLDVNLAGDDDVLRRYFSEISTANGGNAGFLRTVFESLEDAGDANRPQLSEHDAVFGVCLVAGSSDYGQLLSFLAAYKAIFGGGRPGAELNTTGLPVPQAVRVQTTGEGCRVEWAYQPRIAEIPAFGKSVAIRKTAILRSKSPAFISRTDVMGLFGTTTLNPGDAVGVGDDRVEVVAVLDASSTCYFDETAIDFTPHYYAASYQLALGTTFELMTDGGVDLGFQQLSNIVKAVPLADIAAGRSARGIPPDWIRTPNVPALIPDLGALLNRLQGAVTQFSNVTTGYGDMLKSYVSHLETEIAQYEELAEDIGGTVKKLTAMLDVNLNVGVYAKVFDGVGGSDFLRRDFAAAFAPESADPQRPPFDRGDEFVGGLVLLVTAPTVAGLDPAKSLLTQLLLDPQQPSSPIATALAQIDAVLDDAEQQLLPEPLLTTPTLGETDPGNCPVPLASNAEFGDDLLPKE